MVGLLAVVLCAAPAVGVDVDRHSARLLPVKLMTREEARKAPVDSLSWMQLTDEERSLSDLPDLATAQGMRIAGLTAGLVGTVLTLLLVSDFARQTDFGVKLLEVLAAIVTGAVGAAGLAIGVVGEVMHVVLSRQLAVRTARLAQVRARMKAIGEGREPKPTLEPGESAATQERLWQLEDQKPGYSLPLVLLGVGVASAAVGLVGAFTVTAGNPVNYFFAATGALLIGVGLYALTLQINARDALDDELREFEANPPLEVQPPRAPGPQGVDRAPMPPAPVFAAFAARF